MGEASRQLDLEAPEWHDSAPVDELFHRKRRPRPILLGGAILLCAIAMASLVAGLRGEPLLLGEEVVATGLEQLSYRIAASLTLGSLGGWLFLRSLPPKTEADRLTG
jgi:hypothetical protein